MTKTRSVADALALCLQLVDSGYEYPDAEWKASQSIGVNSDDLRDAYDDETARACCITPSAE